MGNTIGKEKHDNEDEYINNLVRLIDGGFLFAHGVYGSEPSYKISIVRRLMLERRLMPFYKGLEEYNANWPPEKVAEVVERALGSQKTMTLRSAIREAKVHTLGQPKSLKREVKSRAERTVRSRSNSVSGNTHAITQDNYAHAISTIYANAFECPICFLYYPPNFNYTRCCAQPICSECFVEIRRPDPHLPTVHANDPQPSDFDLISEPVKCPYCMTDRFGVVYVPNPALSRFSFNAPSQLEPDSHPLTNEIKKLFISGQDRAWVPNSNTKFSYDDQRVITTDLIHPDWQYNLEKARRRAFRRAANSTLLNTHLLEPSPNGSHSESVSSSDNSQPFRSSRVNSQRRALGSRRHQYLANVEQLMMAEAIRQSLEDAQQTTPASNTGVSSVEDGDPVYTASSNFNNTIERPATPSAQEYNAAHNDLAVPSSGKDAYPIQQTSETTDHNTRSIEQTEAFPRGSVNTEFDSVDRSDLEQRQDLEELIHSPIASTNPFLSETMNPADSQDVRGEANVCSPTLCVSDDDVNSPNLAKNPYPSVYEHAITSDGYKKNHQYG
ncbi:zf-C3HC4 type zinc finger [Schizosaccharomyces octosporus yFS286]|uniref:Zf-C3HC4 type zinc finger n=1 Tax=Schizosaccharomyces octosporus (strain yFS286) TaxID=483514 RepID=S9PYF8_SCHOY|nr:zf-C3HC4 type zinc finger [Schizosaccharomyces octosporus yFS286]EPX74101.1 zf-C3HC4 type zinc finger [Schizosaccharomyces octosporus yFS286]